MSGFLFLLLYGASMVAQNSKEGGAIKKKVLTVRRFADIDTYAKIWYNIYVRGNEKTR